MRVETRITPNADKQYPYKVRVFVGGVYQSGATMECKTKQAAEDEAAQLRRAFQQRS